jgi:hypothetical protein
VVLAYVAAQAGWTSQRSFRYLLANAVGSGILAVLALAGRDWGFLLLEGVWCAVSAAGLASVTRCLLARSRSRVTGT